MRKVISILSAAFFLAIACTTAMGQTVVPGAVLYLDSANNPAYPDAWTNLGTAGRELSSNGQPPQLENGPINIPALDISLPHMKYYTAVEMFQTFGGKPSTNPELFLDAGFTLEFLLRRNGDMFLEEHGVFGFVCWQPRQQLTGVVVGDSDLRVLRPEGGEVHGINLELGVWTWIGITSDRKSFIVYQDGEEVGKDEGSVFVKDAPVNTICIGAIDRQFRNRNFNGSFAMVRVYAKALSADEIMGNIIASAAVDPASKLTTAWGKIRISSY